MALRAWDGFDHYASASDIVTRLNGMLSWNGAGGGLLSPGRNGNGKAWSGSLNGAFGQRPSSAFIGVSAFTGTSDLIFFFSDSVANRVQVTVVFTVRNGGIQIFRDNFGTLLASSVNNVWAPGSYFFIEIWPVIDALSGSVTVHLNQQAVLNVSGVQTQVSANQWWDEIGMNGAQAYDDFYYADPTGSAPYNTWLGDPRVYTQFPTANSSVQFTPLANQNWQEVSEVAFDGDTSYNFDSTVGHEDLFTISALPTTITGILGFQVTGAYRKDDAGLREIKQAVKSGATESYGATYALADTHYNYFTDVFLTDPNDGNWTRTTLNAVLIGYNLVA